MEKISNFIKQNKGLIIFLSLGLIVSVLLGVFVSPWASSSPDGLEKVAEDKGFLKKAEETEPAWKHSPIPDYALKGVKNEKVSTGLAGLIGVLITLVAGIVISLVIWLLRRPSERSRPGHET